MTRLFTPPAPNTAPALGPGNRQIARRTTPMLMRVSDFFGSLVFGWPVAKSLRVTNSHAGRGVVMQWALFPPDRTGMFGFQVREHASS